jgi:hypothetical protein
MVLLLPSSLTAPPLSTGLIVAYMPTTIRINSISAIKTFLSVVFYLPLLTFVAPFTYTPQSEHGAIPTSNFYSEMILGWIFIINVI